MNGNFHENIQHNVMIGERSSFDLTRILISEF